MTIALWLTLPVALVALAFLLARIRNQRRARALADEWQAKFHHDMSILMVDYGLVFKRMGKDKRVILEAYRSALALAKKSVEESRLPDRKSLYTGNMQGIAKRIEQLESEGE